MVPMLTTSSLLLHHTFQFLVFEIESDVQEKCLQLIGINPSTWKKNVRKMRKTPIQIERLAKLE